MSTTHNSFNLIIICLFFSLSSSSMDSHTSLDFTNSISPSPPPIFHGSFLPSMHLQHKRNTSSPIQSPLCNTSIHVTNSGPGHERCVSPSSSTCSNSSLEGINTHLMNNLGNSTLHNKNKVCVFVHFQLDFLPLSWKS